jgi:hypothetical protein
MRYNQAARLTYGDMLLQVSGDVVPLLEQLAGTEAACKQLGLETSQLKLEQNL